MIGFVAADDVLRVVFRGVVNIAFESSIRRDFPGDHTAHTAASEFQVTWSPTLNSFDMALAFIFAPGCESSQKR
jgi:hypothetical protein